MNLLLHAAGISLKGGITAYLALTVATSPIQPIQIPDFQALFEDKPKISLEVSKPRQSVQDVLLEVCQDRGYGEACAKHLLGMLWKESKNLSTAVGDNGRARGYFQIWTRLHKISIVCAEDLRCSAEWSLTYLESNSYPKYVNYAIQCHNSCNAGNGYAVGARWHGKRLWNQPLPLTGKRLANR